MCRSKLPVVTLLLSALAALAGGGTARAQDMSDIPLAPPVTRVADNGLAPCLFLSPLLDVSGIDPSRYLRYVILKGDTTAPNQDKLAALSPVKPDAKLDYQLQPTENPDNPEALAPAKVTELFKEGSGPAKITVVSSSTFNESNMETRGQGAISVRNIVDLSGSADILTSQMTAQGTADVHVFKVKLGDTNASLVGLARTQLYFTRSGELLSLSNGNWGESALSTGFGIGLQVPGPTPHHPLLFSVGGGPMLLWDDPAVTAAIGRNPAISGTVLGQVELLAF